MDTRLRQIVPKGPGIYFVVTDNSQVTEIEDENRLRVIFINSQQGPVNCLVKFAQNDTASFTATFGKASRTKEKKGDFGHKVCLDALQAGPIGVINLRSFDDTRDLLQIASINPNTKLVTAVREAKVPYSQLFNRNGYWTPRKENITEKYYDTTGFLNFGNIGTNDVSIFVVKASVSDVEYLTDQYDETLEDTDLEITDYPGLNWNMKLLDTFVKVYVFNNTFKDAHNNKSYGQYFTDEDKVKLGDLDSLAATSSSAFVGSYVGSLIPELKNTNGVDISIDTVMYQDYMNSGVICDINADLLETEISDNGMIDMYGYDAMISSTGSFIEIPGIMSYPAYTYTFDSESPVAATPSTKEDNNIVTTKSATKYSVSESTDNTFVTNSSTGINIDDYIVGTDDLVRVTDISVSDIINESKTEKIFDGTEIKTTESNILYSNGHYYIVNNNKWLTSDDGKNWNFIDLDFNTTPSGKTVTYKNNVNNAVAVSGKVVALGYCEEDASGYVVVYENGKVTFTKLEGTGDQNLNISYGLGTYLLYGKNVYYSNDCLSWTLSTEKNMMSAQYIPNVSGMKFVAVVANTDFSDDYSTEFGGTYSIKISADGINWSNINSDYSSIAAADIRATKNGFLFDDTNVYVLTNNKVYWIEKSKLNVLGNSWKSGTYTATTPYTGNEVYPFISNGSIYVNTNKTNYSLSLDTKNNTVTVGGGLSNIDNKTVAAKRWFIVNNNKVGVGLATDSSYYYITGSGGTVESFDVTYTLSYRNATYTVSGSLKTYGDVNKYIVKINPYVSDDNVELNHFVIESYKPSDSQFLNGTASRQNEILDVMNSQSILKGLRSTSGLAYFVDAFKSYIESGYKKQFGTLCNSLHNSNRFVRAIINEPFITDLLRSTNPLFKDNANDDTINYEYLPQGGNKMYSRSLLSKFTDSEGAGWCFFVGPGDRINGFEKPITGLISNLFYNKSQVFDIAANETGIISGITELEENFDESTDLKYLQKFRYNPVMDINGDIRLYGNTSGQKLVSKQQQWHNVELLCYIKENLYNLARPDIYKKGTYDEYLATQTNVEEFMNTLVVALAIQSDGLVVKCDLENNTTELQNYKIKLVHVEYIPYDCIEKVVFDININK